MYYVCMVEKKKKKMETKKKKMKENYHAPALSLSQMNARGWIDRRLMDVCTLFYGRDENDATG